MHKKVIFFLLTCLLLRGASEHLPADLHKAIAQGRCSEVGNLLTQYYGSNTPPFEKMMLIADNVKMVKYLVSRGASVKILDSDGRNLLMIAVQDGNEDLVSYFINQGLDVNEKDKYGRNSLYFAVGNLNPSINKSILDKGVIVDSQNSDGVTALMRAASEGDVKLFGLLIQSGASWSLKDMRGASVDDYLLADHPSYVHEEDVKAMWSILNKAREYKKNKP